ncbi:hypothetical protein ACWD3J_33735 [Streptomyces sp. NPDC002755]|uniref:hypothetical protein n=1 Tax=Streptomyces sp. NPDC002884 TaxID=3154544 RepID=UPI00332FA3D9
MGRSWTSSTGPRPVRGDARSTPYGKKLRDLTYSSTDEIRRLMIDYVTAGGTLDPAGFATAGRKPTQAGTAAF